MTDIETDSTSEADHSKVAPTAWGVSYLRTFSDIPLTTEFFQVLEEHLRQTDEPAGAWRVKKDRLAPQLEARYKLVDNLLRLTGAHQIIELAAGLAPRGVNFARSNPDIQYVELDLPGVIKEKRAVIADLGIGTPPNLRIEEGDALKASDMAKAASSFSKNKPVAIVNEGLLRYLNFDEKTEVARNVHALLIEFGGAWITPDISLRSALSREDEASGGHIQSLAQTTGIDVSQNVFEDESHARDFFEALGFKIERHSFLEVSDQLVSPAKLGMSPEDVKRLNEPCVAFVMTLADQA